MQKKICIISTLRPSIKFIKFIIIEKKVFTFILNIEKVILILIFEMFVLLILKTYLKCYQNNV